jgi:arginine N-succinyltransferase
MLEEEGFAGGAYIDVFDGGPTMIAETDRIRTIAEAQAAVIAGERASQPQPRLVASGTLGEFRASVGALCPIEGAIALDEATAQTLRAPTGGTVVHAAL